MKRPSASNADAFINCTSSHILPQHDAYHARSEKGTDGHDILAAFINKRPGAASRLAKEFPGLGFKLVELLDNVELIQGEAAYVVDVEKRTSIFLGLEIGRAYELRLGRAMRPYELGVSLDVNGVRRGQHWLRDWKFGLHSSWWQLYIAAMAVLWAPGQTGPVEVDAGFVHIDTWGSEVSLTESPATLYISDLDERADEMVKAFKLAGDLEAQLKEGKSIKTTEGRWCQYCGAYPYCPSKWALAKSMLELDIMGHVSALTAEQCGAAWKKLGEIEKNIIDKTKDALKERLRVEGGFPLENGKRLRLQTMPGRETIDKDAALDLLRAKGATNEEIRALLRSGRGFETVREVKA